jgi:hypothetical protein
MKVVKTKTSEMFMDEHGILHKTVVENCHVTLENLKESDEATRELTEGKKVLVLYDARPHFTLTEDAMEYAQKDIFDKQRIATAIVSDKVGIRITIDYMNKIVKSPIPIRAFSNKEDALKWLLTFRKDTNRKKHKSAVPNLIRFRKKLKNG